MSSETPIAADANAAPSKQRKLEGYDFWRTSLNSAKWVVAPMVDGSELPWRILSRRYGAELCYTPMFNARIFVDQPKYREEQWSTCAKDRPLIVQFCANDPEVLLRAAKLVENDCDGVDLNLGCPQHIAKRGHYGSFLMEEWDLISSMVKLLHRELAVPVTCKIRVYPDEQKTLDYAKMLQDSGCQLLTVHGRIREQKGHNTGLADWNIIKKVKESLSIPVFANGNILHHSDLERCLEATGCDGIMTAEGNLYNPALFTRRHPPVWEMAQEYLDICSELGYDKTSIIRGHLFKILKPSLSIHVDLRDALPKINEVDEFKKIVRTLQERLENVRNADTLGKPEMEYIPSPIPDEELDPKIHDPSYGGTYYRYPYWICQPYIRQGMPSEMDGGDVIGVVDEAMQQDKILIGQKRQARKEAKKQGREKNKKRRGACIRCGNVKSTRCAHEACKPCCKSHFIDAGAGDCEEHSPKQRFPKIENPHAKESTDATVTTTAAVTVECSDAGVGKAELMV